MDPLPSSFVSNDSQQQPLLVGDIVMDDASYQDMPALQDVSDSSDDDDDNNNNNNNNVSLADGESDRDAHEVEMQAVEEDDIVPGLAPVDVFPSYESMPPSSSVSSSSSPPFPPLTPQRSTSNRRARVEDDEDEDRDRRHPSQRISSASITPSLVGQSSPSVPHNHPLASASTASALPSTSTSPPTSTPFPAAPQQAASNNPPPFDHRHMHFQPNMGFQQQGATNANAPFRLFQHLMHNHNGATNTATPPHFNNTNSTTAPGTPLPQPPLMQPAHTAHLHPPHPPHTHTHVFAGPRISLEFANIPIPANMTREQASALVDGLIPPELRQPRQAPGMAAGAAAAAPGAANTNVNSPSGNTNAPNANADVNDINTQIVSFLRAHGINARAGPWPQGEPNAQGQPGAAPANGQNQPNGQPQLGGINLTIGGNIASLSPLLGGMTFTGLAGPGVAGATPGALGAAPNAGGAGAGATFPFPGAAALFGFGPLGFGPMGFGQEEKEDPERARKLVDGLDEVPVGLVKRLERVGGGVKGGGEGDNGEEGGNGQGDGGCAICWDRLLCGEDADAEGVDDDTKNEESEQPKIVSLPCAHVFHAECLIPWFSRPRHTTCPTCRFNIDPEGLTYVSPWTRARAAAAAAAAAAPPAAGAAPEAGAIDARVVTDDVPALEHIGATGAAAQPQPPATAAPAAAPPPADPVMDDLRQFWVGAGLPEQDAPRVMEILGGDFGGFLRSLGGVGPGVGQPQQQPQQQQAAPIGGASGQPQAQPHAEAEAQQNPAAQPQLPEVAFQPVWELFRRVFRPDGMGGMEPHLVPVAPAPAPPPAPHTNAPAPAPGQANLTSLLTQLYSINGGETVQEAYDALMQFEAQRGAAPAPAANPWNFTVDPAAAAGPAGAGANPTAPPPGNAGNVNAPQNDPPLMPTGGNWADLLSVTVEVVQGPAFDIGGQNPAPQARHMPPAAGVPLDATQPTTTPLPNATAAPPAGPTATATPEGRDEQLGRMLNTEDIQRLIDLDEEEERMEQAEMARFNEFLNVMMSPPGQQAPAPGPSQQVPLVQQQPQQQAQPHSHPQQPQQPPQQQAGGPLPMPPFNRPPGAAGFMSLGGISVASGTGRSVAEAVTQLFAGIPRQPAGQMNGATPQVPPQATPQAQAQGPPPAAPAQGWQPQPQVPLVQTQTQPQANPGAPGIQFGVNQPRVPFMINPFETLFGGGLRRGPLQPEGPKRPWTLPAAPGPTLRQRIERREREAGLRCFDVSCGIGPSDEDPVVEVVGELTQLAIRQKEDGHGHGVDPLCEHRFHSACLVSAERVALRGADAVIDEDGRVEVSCPVCRGVGCVSKEEWEDGVRTLV